MKHNLIFKSALLLLAIFAGSSSVWATTYKSFTGGNQQASTTISTQNVSSGSVGVISWTGTSCTYSSNRVNIAANGSITFTAQSGYNISKIVIVSGSSADYYGTWTSNPSVTPTASSGTTTFDGLSSNSVTITTSTAFRCTSASSISVHYVSAGPSAEETSITINGAGITNTDVYTSTAAGSLSATVKDASNSTISGASVTWSGNNDNVATIDASTGAVTLVAKGTVTFTATYAGVSGQYQGSSATYQMTVTSSEPYTQPTEIEIIPNYTFWGKTAQFSGNDNTSLSGSKDNVTLEWTKGEGSTYANANAMRFYKDNTLTFSAPTGYHIKSIAIEGTLQSDMAFSPAGFDTETSTWTGSSETVEMSRPASGLSYASINKYTITIGVPAETCAVPTFNPEAGSYTAAQNVVITTVTDGATIYYTTDGTNPTTSSNVYSSAISVSSNMTIKAIAVKEGNENSAVATAEYTIINLAHAGTEADPYTVDDAYTAIDNNMGLENVYVTGIVSGIVTAYNSQYGNISYNISADGQTTGNQLQAYHGKGIDGANFTSEDDIQVGDEVVVKGTLKKYNDTYEFDANNQLVSLNRPVVPIIVADGPVNLAYDATSGEISYEVNNATTGVSLTATSEADWISNIVVTAEKVTFTTTANEGNADRTGSITLAYTGADSKTVEVIQAHYIPDYATLDFAYDGNGAGELPEGLTVSGTGTYSSTPKIKFDTTGDYIILKINEIPGVLTFDIKGNSFSGGTFTVQTSTDGVTYTDLQTYTGLTTDLQSESFDDLAADVRYIKWIYTEKSNGNVALGNIKLVKPVAKETINLTATLSDGRYWTTFYNSLAGYMLPEGAQAFTMNEEKKLYRLGTEGNVVPVGTAVIIIADTANITLTQSTESAAINGSTNILIGSNGVAISGITGTPYVLGIVGEKLGFYQYTGANIPAGKAYYVVNE